MHTEDYIMRQIRQIIEALLQILQMMLKIEKVSPEEIKDEFEKSNLLEPFSEILNPELSEDELNSILNHQMLNGKTGELMAELLIKIAEHNPEQEKQFFMRAKRLLSLETDTISLHRMELLSRIPD